jgi:hypothetical protein
MTHAQHDDQRARVAASLRLADKPATRRDVYPVRKPSMVGLADADRRAEHDGYRP